MDAGEDGEQAGLARHGETEDCGFHKALRDFDSVEDFSEQALGALGGAGGERGALVEHDAMGEDGDGEAFDVVGEGVIAAFEEGEGLDSAEEGLGAAGADAEGEQLAGAGGVHDGEHVADEGLIDGDELGGGLEGEELGRREGQGFMAGAPA